MKRPQRVVRKVEHAHTVDDSGRIGKTRVGIDEAGSFDSRIQSRIGPQPVGSWVLTSLGLAKEVVEDEQRQLIGRVAKLGESIVHVEVASGVELKDRACQGMHGRVDFAALAPGGTFALIASRTNNRAVLVPAGCGEDIELVGHSGPVTGATFSPDGDLVATISTDNTTKLWSTRYGNDIDTLDTGSGSVHSVNFSRDGARLVIATARDAWVYSLNLDEGNKPVVFATLQGHSAAVLHASFSSNGARIVTASSDNTAKLWALASPGYELIATLHGHSAAVSFADFSPDGALVVTAGRDSRAKVYPTTLEAFFKKACEALRSHSEDFDEVAIVCGGGP